MTGEAVRIFGGMGLMDDLPIEPFRRGARVGRIRDGAGGIRRRITARGLFRPPGA